MALGPEYEVFQSPSEGGKGRGEHMIALILKWWAASVWRDALKIRKEIFPESKAYHLDLR